MPTGIGGEIAWWCPSLDDTGNGTTTLYDLIGTRNGTLTNMDAATDWVADTTSGGVRALDFDGTNDHVQVGGTVPSLGSQFSITVFARPNSVSGNLVITSCRSTTLTNPICYQIDRNGTDYRFLVRDDSGVIAVATATASASIGTWAAIAAVRDGNNLAIYIDGDLAASNSAAFGTVTPNSINIGATVSGGTTRSAFWNGRIDDCRLFSGVISSTVITNLSSMRGYQPTGRARRKINDGLFNRGLFNAGLLR